MKHLIIGILAFLLITQTCAQSLTDIDVDDNGLIEIHNLEMLNAIRYQLDGTAYTTSAAATKITAGCAIGGCKGYELISDLDFMDDASYASTANKARWTVADYTDSEDRGWEPIGTENDVFNAIFEGNNYIISNLMINRSATNFIGLFGFAGSNAALANLGLLDTNARGNQFVGSLAGGNGGSIRNSYATATVAGSDNVGGLTGLTQLGNIVNSYATATVTGSDNVGGLTGWNADSFIVNSYATGTVTASNNVGGLAGWNQGDSFIVNSYATGTVAGSNNVGGLTGENSGSNITNSYATGNVTGTIYVGGLIGENEGTITNAYATGIVAGSDNVGGLAGENGGAILNSYWDAQTSGITVSAGGTSKTTTELQSPTMATGIYSIWSAVDWSFGNSSLYPALKYIIGPDTNNPACDVPTHPVCGSLLPKQFSSQLAKLSVINGTLSPPFDPEIMDYDVLVNFDVTHLELQTTATATTGASLHIRSDAADTEVLDSDAAKAAMPLKLINDTLISIEVVEGEQIPTSYRLNVSYATDDDTPRPSTLTIVVDDPSVQPIAEGTTATLRAILDDESICGPDLRCRWGYVDAASRLIELLETESNAVPLQLNFMVPTDYVPAAQTTHQLVVVFATRNRGGLVSTETSFVIIKQNNGFIDAETIAPPILIGRTLIAPDIDLADDPDGVNADHTLRYQWQRAKNSAVDLSTPTGWEDIGGATAITYTLAATSYTPPHRVRIRYTDAQGYTMTIYTQWIRDIDTDDDGLIEIRNIEELHAMRYQLDGSGSRAGTDAEKITTGCAVGGCVGYELLRDLNFIDDTSYALPSNKARWTVADYADNKDTGWEPIGTEGAAFNAIFEGNGRTLSDLMINRSAANYVGLFGYTGNTATLVNLALLRPSIRGNNYVSALAGRNQGRIANSYATKIVTEANNDVGGLVGVNDGRIMNSYATGAVTGKGNNVGGLTGRNGLSITNSYATAAVAGEGRRVGGLVGWNQARLASSYAIGTVIGEGDYVGGLVGQNAGGIITSSYWDRQTSGLTVGDGGTHKTTQELQSHTTATGIYSDWSTANWDFSNPSFYPLLKYAIATDVDYATCNVYAQPTCGDRLPDQFLLLDGLLVSNGTLSPSFNSEVFAYDLTVAFNVTHLELQATATEASLHISNDASDIEVINADTVSTAIPLNPRNDTVIYIELRRGERKPEVYSLTVSYENDSSVPKPSAPIVIVDHRAQPIAEGATAILRVVDDYQCSADLICRWYYLDAASRLTELAEMELSDDLLQLNFTVPTDYVAATQTIRQLVVLFAVSNRGGTASVETPFGVIKQDDGPIDAENIASATLSDNTLNAPEIDLTDDPDGANAEPTLRYQWQRAKSGAVNLDDPTNWDDIEDAISKTYAQSEDPQTIILYRVQIRYTDGQGYENTIYSMPIEVRPGMTEPGGTGLKVRLKVFLESPL